MTDWIPNVCLYHDDCFDGFGAAWAIHKKWPDIEFVPVAYSRKPPDVTGKDVLMVDFSYPQETLLKMSARSMIILDHHKTAEAELRKYSCPMITARESIFTESSILAVFDMTKSGAHLAWEFAFGYQELPAGLRYIEDGDLGKYQYPVTNAFRLALDCYPRTFEKWDILMLADLELALIKEGEPVSRSNKMRAERAASKPIWLNIRGSDVPTVNVPHVDSSAVCYALLRENSRANFVATYQIEDTGVRFSLRSENSRYDVSEVASHFGGGGHRNAAGFHVPLAQLAEMMYSILETTK